MHEWIKLEHDTQDKAEIAAMLDAGVQLLDPRDALLGALTRFWIWVDRNCVDKHTHMTERGLNRFFHARGLAQAMCLVGWLEKGEDGTMDIVNFDKHCSVTAKLRARKAMEKANYRAIKGGDTCRHGVETHVAKGGDKCHPRVETKKKNTPKSPTPRTPNGGGAKGTYQGAGGALGNDALGDDAAPMTDAMRAEIEREMQGDEQ